MGIYVEKVLNGSGYCKKCNTKIKAGDTRLRIYLKDRMGSWHKHCAIEILEKLIMELMHS